MKQFTWKPHCPIALQDLREVHLNYWGLDNKTHRGVLIVNKELATEVEQIFTIIYEHKFPIARMELIENYQGNDDLSMVANNTSAFNCREIKNKPGKYSQHTYGRAIDINPLFNPYVNKKKVEPPKGKNYLDRSKKFPGKIDKNSIVYKAFMKYGWDWGGRWQDVKDYHHFEKRAGGEKRSADGS